IRTWVSSSNQVDIDLCASTLALCRADEDVMVQPGIRPFGRFEARRDTTVRRRQRWLTSLDALQILPRTEGHATVVHVDRHTVVGLQHVVRLEFDEAVRPQAWPVATGLRQHPALQQRTTDTPAGHRYEAATEIEARRCKTYAL